jgi:trigger factor
LQLTITVGAADIRSEYDALTAKYGKTIQIPGFRKGKVPRDVLLRKFGDAVKEETLGNIVEKAVSEVFDNKSFPKEKRPLPYSTPCLKEDGLKLDMDKDLTFAVTYDVFPSFDVGIWKGLVIETPDAEVTNEDINLELNAIRERNAFVLDKDDAAKAAAGDVVTVNYAEISDGGEILPGTERQDFTFTLGSGYNIFKFDDDVAGMKKGKSKDIEKSYPEDFEDKDLAGKTKKIRVTLTALKEKKLPDMDDELAQDVDEKFKTLEDLKNSIRERLAKNLERRLREIAVSRILEKIAENSPIDIPESMVRIELEGRWRNLAQRLALEPEDLLKNVEKSGGSMGAVFDGWRPDVIKALCARLIVEKLIKDLGIDADDEGLQKEFDRIAGETGTPVDEIKKQYESGEIKAYLKEEIKERKLLDLLLAENTIKKGSHTKYLDLVSHNG